MNKHFLDRLMIFFTFFFGICEKSYNFAMDIQICD